MEYGCLIVQSTFLLLTLIPTNDRYLVEYNEFYKKYLIVELITQVMCIVANLIILFLMKEIMIYIVIMHIMLMGEILIFYSNKAKKLYFDELLNIIVANNLQAVDSREIKKILLENYGKLYFVEDIEKCKNHIKNI